MAQHELIADAFSGNVKLAKKVHDAMRRLANTPPAGYEADACHQ
jgi:hypothetical protein